MKTEVKTTESSPERIEVVVAVLMRAGVIISALVMTIGLLLLIHSSAGTALHVTGTSLKLKAIINGLRSCQPIAVIQTGLLLLILTPVFRIAAAAIIYIVDGDKDFAIITGFVLAILLAGMLLGRIG